MPHENNIAAREIIVDDICTRVPDYLDADGQPILDETGNIVKDEQNNTVLGEPASGT